MFLVKTVENPKYSLQNSSNTAAGVYYVIVWNYTRTAKIMAYRGKWM